MSAQQEIPCLECVYRSSSGGLSNPKDPSIQIIPTLGRKVCKYYLHWAIWIPRVRLSVQGLGL